MHLGRHGVVPFGDEIEIRQGVEIGRPSTLYARAARRGRRAEVGGSAVVVARGALPRAVMFDSETFSALASPKRLQILEWLKDPEAHFPPQRDGDLVEDGVCVVFIADKLGVAQPTATAHLKALARAGLVTSKRQAGWTFYKRDEQAIAALKREFRDRL